jgi:hypothetical protein
MRRSPAYHSFWYADAVKEFGDIAQTEPDCAIAYWGLALSLWNQLWAPPRPEALQKGSDATQKAVALGASPPETTPAMILDISKVRFNVA